MTEKSHRAEVQFRGYMDVNATAYEGVTDYDVEDAIDDMSEEEAKRWLKFNYETCHYYREKDE